MRTIKQGHTRWRLDTFCGPDGRPERVYVVQCYCTKVREFSVEYHDGLERRMTSHWAWKQMYPTFRKAMREAILQCKETDVIRDAEYMAGWEEF